MTIAINLPEALQKKVMQKMAVSQFESEEELILSAISYYMEHEAEESEIDADWQNELDRRLVEIENGTAVLMDGDVALTNLRTKLANYRNAASPTT
jgi:hypothetical protein